MRRAPGVRIGYLPRRLDIDRQFCFAPPTTGAFGPSIPDVVTTTAL